jgi:hypothetical protein
MNIFGIIVLTLISSTCYVKLEEFEIKEWILKLPADDDNLLVGLLINENTISISYEYRNFLIKYKNQLNNYDINLGIVI